MKHFCYILGSACAVFWHNILNRFIFASCIPRRTKTPPGCREPETKRFNKYPVVVRACVHTCARAHVSHRSTPNPVTRLLKRFTAKMPLCNCLIFNEIKYFLKFFLHLKKIAVTLQQKQGHKQQPRGDGASYRGKPAVLTYRRRSP